MKQYEIKFDVEKKPKLKAFLLFLFYIKAVKELDT